MLDYKIIIAPMLPCNTLEDIPHIEQLPYFLDIFHILIQI